MNAFNIHACSMFVCPMSAVFQQLFVFLCHLGWIQSIDPLTISSDRIIQTIKTLQLQTLSLKTRSPELIVDNISLLLSNFHLPTPSPGKSSNDRRSSLITVPSVRGHRELTTSAARGVVGLIRSINRLAPATLGQTPVPLGQTPVRSERKSTLTMTTTTAGENDDDVDGVAIVALATAQLVKKNRKSITVYQRTFLTIVSQIHKSRTPGSVPRYLLPLELIPAAWDVHLGRIWARRKELSALVGIVSWNNLWQGLFTKFYDEK